MFDFFFSVFMPEEFDYFRLIFSLEQERNVYKGQEPLSKVLSSCRSVSVVLQHFCFIDIFNNCNVTEMIVVFSLLNEPS